MINNIYDPIKELNQEINQEACKIHIRVKQRNGKKSTTSIEGLSANFQTTLQSLRKVLACNGSIQDSNVILLFGDQRIAIKKYLIDNNIAANADIIVHGY